MLGSDILDVVIGMVFIYLLLSLVCSAAAELLEAALKQRARKLEQGLLELLGDPKNETKFVNALYDHGVVNALFRGKYATTPKGQLPSYIPSRNFALALMDLISNPPQNLALPPNVVTALRTFDQAAAGDIAKYQAGIEDWYNSAMDRVAGWYKRHTQGIILGMGLAIAIAANADSIQFGKALSNDASLRKGIIAAAQARAVRPLNAADDPKADARIRKDLDSLSGLGLPIGWSDPAHETAWAKGIWPPVVRIYMHWFGWLLTAIAISLGAPFWFDLLNKFIVIRSTVKPHEKSQEEHSKDGALA